MKDILLLIIGNTIKLTLRWPPPFVSYASSSATKETTFISFQVENSVPSTMKSINCRNIFKPIDPKFFKHREFIPINPILFLHTKKM